MKKSSLIVAGIVLAAIALAVVMVAGINNRAISLEEQISGAEAQISVAEKRRVDLIYNLVDTVTAYQEYEGETMLAITEARGGPGGQRRRSDDRPERRVGAVPGAEGE